jgi:UDP-2,3-diacylglucosamine hydrolase
LSLGERTPAPPRVEEESLRRVALLADAHLSGPGGPAAPLVRQLEELPGLGCERLVLMGDLFQVWVGEERFATPDIAAVVAALRRLRTAGLAIDYIEGNRDFFLAESPYRDAFDRVALEATFTVRGVRYLAVHGDGLNDRDWQYRFWRRLSKSGVAHHVLKRTPRGLASRLVGATERRLSRTNFRHRHALPEKAIRAFAEKRLAEGHDILLLGHFHEAMSWQLDRGEVRLLPAWFRTRELVWLGGEASPVDPRPT